MKYYFQITVNGRGAFPIDMLRYSQVYPRDLESVANIENIDNVGNRRDTVNMDDASFGAAMNCVKRFASFGWVGEITNEERV